MSEKSQKIENIHIFPSYQEERFPNIHKLIITFQEFLKDIKAKKENSETNQIKNIDKIDKNFSQKDKEFKKILYRELG